MRNLLIAVSMLTLAACGQTTATTDTQPETPAVATAPTNAAEATAQDTCGASAHQALIGPPASAIDLANFAPGTRIITPETMVTQDFVPTRLNITVGSDGNVASLNCY
ncbi:MAG: I78 family peptidase inhibitor [Caulobacteraceae bacterium]